MSREEFKSGFRVNIESLRGKSRTEALAYFRTILGEPDEIYHEDDGKVEYFRYKGEYQPQQEFTYQAYPSKNDGWFVDKIVFKDDTTSDCGLYLLLDRIKEEVEALKTKFNVTDKDIMIFAYTWYNGCDEPRYMQPPIQE